MLDDLIYSILKKFNIEYEDILMLNRRHQDDEIYDILYRRDNEYILESHYMNMLLTEYSNINGIFICNIEDNTDGIEFEEKYELIGYHSMLNDSENINFFINDKLFIYNPHYKIIEELNTGHLNVNYIKRNTNILKHL